MEVMHTSSTGYKISLGGISYVLSIIKNETPMVILTADGTTVFSTTNLLGIVEWLDCSAKTITGILHDDSKEQELKRSAETDTRVVSNDPRQKAQAEQNRQDPLFGDFNSAPTKPYTEKQTFTPQFIQELKISHREPRAIDE